MPCAMIVLRKQNVNIILTYVYMHVHVHVPLLYIHVYAHTLHCTHVDADQECGVRGEDGGREEGAPPAADV